MKKIKNLLIVDDDAVSSYLIESTIEDMGIADKVVKAYNGLQALQFLEANFGALNASNQEFSSLLILLDLNMPVMNGFEFLEQFSTQYASIKDKVAICVLSSSSAPRDLLKARQYNVAGYIAKPLSEENFMPILEKVQISC
jgi:CheY-like chemotaxis protein